MIWVMRRCSLGCNHSWVLNQCVYMWKSYRFCKKCHVYQKSTWSTNGGYDWYTAEPFYVQAAPNTEPNPNNIFIFPLTPCSMPLDLSDYFQDTKTATIEEKTMLELDKGLPMDHIDMLLTHINLKR